MDKIENLRATRATVWSQQKKNKKPFPHKRFKTFSENFVENLVNRNFGIQSQYSPHV